jgi:hypothetical protein
VFVHLPEQAAWTKQADYQIYLPDGRHEHRVVPTRIEENAWVDIGVFDFLHGTGTPRVELSNFTKDGAYWQDVAFDAIAVQPLPQKPRHFVVGLGDSFSSGEGAGYYSRVSDQYGDDPEARDACHRSSKSWQRQMVIPGTPDGATVGALADAHDKDMDLHIAACSGAVTAHIMSTTNLDGTPAPPAGSGDALHGLFGELSQLDQGWLDENTTLVVLSIGGNDMKWAQAVEACVYGLDCSAPGFTREGDPQPLRYMIVNRIPTVREDVRRVLREIHERAPNARIVQAGYPHLFEPGTSYSVPYIPGLTDYGLLVTSDEVDFLTEMTDLAMDGILLPDAALNASTVDVRPAFTGHALGVQDAFGQYFNPLFVPGDKFHPTDDDGEPSTSFKGPHSGHPNVDGNQGYATAVSTGLLTAGYYW